MVLTPEQVKTLRDLRTDMGEVIMMTAAFEWDEVKDRSTNLTFDMILDWLKALESVVGVPEQN